MEKILDYMIERDVHLAERSSERENELFWHRGILAGYDHTHIYLRRNGNVELEGLNRSDVIKIRLYRIGLEPK